VERQAVGIVTDQEPFAAFYRERYPAAVRLAWLLTGDAGTSEDAAQEAFTSLNRHWAAVTDPPAYLRMAIVNGCRQRARSRAREERRIRLVAVPEIGRDADAPLLDAVARLPYRQRAAVVLRYWADLPDADIACTLDVAPSTVRSLLARGIATLRKEIER
jgi:RNA polymerase sigma factor (sigma-70 family)